MPITLGFKALLSSAIGIASTTAAIFFWKDSVGGAAVTAGDSLLHYNNDNSHALATDTNNAPIQIDTDNHHVLLRGNWAIMISTDWTPSQYKHVQWWKDSQVEYGSTKSTKNTLSAKVTEHQSGNDDAIQFAYVDGTVSPELVALLQVRGYPSIRLVTDNGTHLRTFNRALLLSPATFIHYLRNWRSNLAVWGEFGGVRGWGRLYVWQVRVFNVVWGGMQRWQVKLIENLRERRRMMTAALVGAGIGAAALYRFGYLQTVL